MPHLLVPITYTSPTPTLHRAVKPRQKVHVGHEDAVGIARHLDGLLKSELRLNLYYPISLLVCQVVCKGVLH